MVVDDRWVSLGSSNLDDRSFELNDETNLNVHDADFARTQRDLFMADLANAPSRSPPSSTANAHC